MLMCNETVTLIRHIKTADGDSYEPIIITGASWFGKFKLTPGDASANAATEITVRVPAEQMPGGIIPRTGDYMARGAVSVYTLEEIGKTESFEILSVGDNRRGRLKHWRVSGA